MALPARSRLPFLPMKALLSFFIAAPFLHAAEPVPLFNGQSLDGWQGTPGMWRVEDGAITGEIKDGAKLDRNEWIWWKDEVHDFELELEYKITGEPSANSGIQIRSQRDAKGTASGLQCDLDAGAVWLGRIYDEHGRALVMERGTRVSIAPDGRKWADPFAEAKSFTAAAKANDWNRYRIRAEGSHVQVWVNDVFFGALDDHETRSNCTAGRGRRRCSFAISCCAIWERRRSPARRRMWPAARRRAFARSATTASR